MLLVFNTVLSMYEINDIYIHDLLMNSNSDLHWSLLGTFILKKIMQNVLRVTVFVSDWLNDDFRVFPTYLTL